MARRTHIHPVDLHGLARLATDATSAVTDIVEAMHQAITTPTLARAARTGRAGGLAGLAYSSVRGVTSVVGGAVDLAAAPILPMFGERASTPQRDALISVLNGVVGDHLLATGNPLAIRMELRRRGAALVLDPEVLAKTLPHVTPKVVVMIHGLCGTDAQWKRGESDYAAMLEKDFGFTPVYLRYNSGLHISTNGRALSDLLEELCSKWPVPLAEILLVGHSMGGLVARSAVHQGRELRHGWPARLRRMAFLGSPHHGAPLERGGNWFEEIVGSIPFASPLSRLGRLRSAGVTDLRHGSLLDEDWSGTDRFARGRDRRRLVPLPADVDCLAIAATTGARKGDARDRLVGDGLVPVASALGEHDDARYDLAFEPSRRRILYRTHHMRLLAHPEVAAILTGWLEDSAGRSA